LLPTQYTEDLTITRTVTIMGAGQPYTTIVSATNSSGISSMLNSRIFLFFHERFASSTTLIQTAGEVIRPQKESFIGEE